MVHAPARDHDRAAADGRGRALDRDQLPALHHQPRRLVSPVDAQGTGGELERGDHRATVDARAARVEQRVADRAEWRVHGACFVDGHVLEHIRVAIERDGGVRGEGGIVAFAEPDPQGAAHVVTRIGRPHLGQRGDESSVVLTGEVGEIEERRLGSAVGLGRQDPRAGVGRAADIVAIEQRDRWPS